MFSFRLTTPSIRCDHHPLPISNAKARAKAPVEIQERRTKFSNRENNNIEPGNLFRCFQVIAGCAAESPAQLRGDVV
jgi:hypothetical protein